MTDLAPLLLPAAAGLALGLVYFGALWLTVRALPAARSPALLTLASLTARLALLLLGFHAVAAGRWERLLACLAGFVLARLGSDSGVV